MSTVAATRFIQAPTREVWQVFTDLGRRHEWLSAVTRVEVRTSGPFGAGTVWRETRLMADGTEVTEEFRVLEFTAGERFVVVSPGMGADYRMTYEFTPHRRGTTVTVVQDGTPTARAGRLLALVFGGLAAEVAEGALRRDLDDLAAAA